MIRTASFNGQDSSSARRGGECETGLAGRSEPVTEPLFLRSCVVFGAHLGKGCASSKESPGFSKMRTSRKGCASSNKVRTFEAGPRPCTPVPFARKVAQALASASIALFSTGRNCLTALGLTAFNILPFLRYPEDQGDPQITPISPIRIPKICVKRRNLRIACFSLSLARTPSQHGPQ